MAEGLGTNDALHEHDADTMVAAVDASSAATPVIDAGMALTGDSIKVAEPREAPRARNAWASENGHAAASPLPSSSSSP